MGEKRGLWTVTEMFIKFLAEEAASSQLVVVCTVDLVSIYVEFLPDTGWTEEEITFSDESGDESTITSVSEKKPNYRVIRLEKKYKLFRGNRISAINSEILHFSFTFIRLQRHMFRKNNFQLQV